MNSMRKMEWILTLPTLSWLFVFFLIPTSLIFIYSFKPADPYGGVGSGWSLEAFYNLLNPTYYRLIGRTLFLSAMTTLCCLILSMPVGYHLATTSKRKSRLLLMLFILPFWTSFLIRIFAWKILLHPEGYIKNILVTLHLVDPMTPLLYNQYAVLIVMVYTYLPFAIFPIYAAASKFNFQLLEAAMDLGANRRQTFFKIFIPGISKGIFTASTMVFIASIGAYIIPDLIGGINSEMISNKIAQKFFVDRNLPEASALSLFLSLIVLIPLFTIIFLRRRPKLLETDARNRE